MSICTNFEGALMKAIRSLEQHVDSMMSYDFTELSKEELLKQLEVVDDRRIWVIAEAIRKGISYDTIHEITMIDHWFIDKIAILVEMEERLRSEELTTDLLKEAKRIEFPDNVIAEQTGKTEEEISELSYENGIEAAIKMQNLKPAHRIITPALEVSTRQKRHIRRKKYWYLVPDRSVSDRVSSLTIVPYTVPGRLQKKAMRPLL